MTEPIPHCRQRWMSLLAKAPEALLVELWQQYTKHSPPFEWLRKPEIGLAMVQGRAGGTGSAFNLGEVSITRCSVQLPSSVIGHAYVQGRSREKAQIAALCDALMQTEAAADIQKAILTPLAEQASQWHALQAAKAAATKVDFFTLVRGED